MIPVYKLLISAIILFILSILFVYVVFFKFKEIKKRIKIFWAIITFSITAHILFFFITGYYLITTGLFLIIICGLLFYAFFLIAERIGKYQIKIKEIRLVIISVSICLCFIESLFVLTGFKSTYSEKKHVFYYPPDHYSGNINWFWTWKNDHELETGEYSYFRHINSEGLSDKERIVKKNSNEFLIMGLGDSFTEGDGAHADSTWLKFLERNLAKYPLKKQLTYFNAGVCGSDPYFEYILLKKRLLKYKPDLVLLALNSSDISDVLIRGGLERFKPNGTVQFHPAPWWEPIYASLHVSRLVFSALGYNELLYKEKEENFIKEKEEIVDIIDSFNKLSFENNFKFVVIFHPFKGEINANELELKNVMKRVSEDNKVEVMDMLEYFVEKENINSINSQKYFWKLDGHHNAKGYAAFARGVEWKLKEIGIIDSLMLK